MRTTFHGSRLGPDLLLIAHRLFVLAFIYLFISWLPDHFVPCLLQVELYYHHIVSPPRGEAILPIKKIDPENVKRPNLSLYHVRVSGRYL